MKIALSDDDSINAKDRENKDNKKVGIIDRLRALFKKDANNKKNAPLAVTNLSNPNVQKLCVYSRAEHKRMEYDIVSTTSQISSKYTSR